MTNTKQQKKKITVEVEKRYRNAKKRLSDNHNETSKRKEYVMHGCMGARTQKNLTYMHIEHVTCCMPHATSAYLVLAAWHPIVASMSVVVSRTQYLCGCVAHANASRRAVTTARQRERRFLTYILITVTGTTHTITLAFQLVECVRSLDRRIVRTLVYAGSRKCK